MSTLALIRQGYNETLFLTTETDSPHTSRFPVLHKTHFVADWKTLKEKGITKADPVFLCILFAVFACGSLVVKDERVNAEGGYSAKSVPDPKTGDYSFGLAKSHRNRGVERPGARFYAQANVLLLRTVAEPSVELAILYGLMAFYHVANNAAARSWVLCGQALRIAIVSERSVPDPVCIASFDPLTDT